MSNAPDKCPECDLPRATAGNPSGRHCYHGFYNPNDAPIAYRESVITCFWRAIQRHKARIAELEAYICAGVSWAKPFIERLQRGETVQFRPRGRSMEPQIRSEQLCTVEPLREHAPTEGDVVLCTIAGSDYLHKVIGVDKADGTFLIGNNRGRHNGWVARDAIHGRLVRVEP